ncbi:hypothetical protein FQA39_LY15813 [Lamprigera yunnana]|nr:hypothetical protein FQA39_LY15813 [Lamprigera yunnana]
MANIDSFLNKKYILVSSENLEEYLKETGINMLMRQLAKKMSPEIELTRFEDEYTFTSVTTLTSTVLKFKLGVEFEKQTPDGQVVRSVFTTDGCVLTEVQTDSMGRVTTIERTFSDDQVTAVIKLNDVVAKTYYKLK